MSKQDRQGARTPADLERRYGLGGLGKSFSEVLGASKDASASAAQAQEDLDGVKKNVEQELVRIEADLNDVEETLQEHFVFSEKEVSFPVCLRIRENRYAFQAGSFGGRKGYTAIATVLVKGADVDAPVTFVLSERGIATPATVHVRFSSVSASEDPPVSSFLYEGADIGAFLVKRAPYTWTLYVDNTDGQRCPCAVDWYTSKDNAERLSVSFPKEQIISLPADYIKATPWVGRSVLDTVMPVGFVLTLYSHADPNAMYPGTSWERITKAFLWACDADGEIGAVGGEETHILTEEEMPSHGHGAVYTDAGEGAKTYAGLASGGSAMAYEPVATGGGQAHNNMPPYVQVSVWRRTA